MSGRSTASKIGSVVLALSIGTVVVALAGSVLLPSTKRARVDLDQVRPIVVGDETIAATAPSATADAAADVPSTSASPSTLPTTP